MSDPARWKDLDGGASRDALDLLRHARPPAALDAATRAKVAAAVMKTAAVPATAGVFGAKWLLGAGLASALTVGAVTAYRTPRPPAASAHAPAAQTSTRRGALPIEATRAPVGTAAAVTSNAPTLPPAPAAPTPVTVAPALAPRVVAHAAPTNPRPTRGGHTIPTTAPSTGGYVAPSVTTMGGVTPPVAPVVAAAAAPPPPDLQDETNVLIPRADEPPAAQLARAERHAQEFPHGQMAGDRECLAIFALRDLGRVDDARRRSESLLRRYPSAPCASQARRMLLPAP